MRNPRWIALSAGVLLIAGENDALALQGGEDPALLPVLVDKRFGGGGKHQLSVLFTTAIVTKFVESVGAYGGYQYSFSDIFGVELSGGYFFGSESSIMEEVRTKVAGQPPFSDLYQLQWAATANAVLVPIYGKMSFAAVLDPAFDLFVLAGGGVAGTRQQISGVDAPKEYDTSVGPVFSFGGGLRFYFNRYIALRLELRDFFYPDPDPDEGGFTFNLHFQGGLQAVFGGD